MGKTKTRKTIEDVEQRARDNITQLVERYGDDVASWFQPQRTQRPWARGAAAVLVFILGAIVGAVALSVKSGQRGLY